MLTLIETSFATELETIGRKIVYDGWLAIEVENIGSTIEQIQRITQEMKGFISQMLISKDSKVRSASLTLRISQADFYATLQRISQLSELTDKRVSSQDVTERYVDLEARLKNAQREEQHLFQLFDKAQKVDEMLSIERELTRVCEQIELYISQLKYLERRVEYATITVLLTEPSPSVPWILEFKWDVPFKIGFQILLTIIQGLIITSLS
ncbi:MAG: DUF4349 domain-containing protein [Nitrososphaerales archaeon]